MATIRFPIRIGRRSRGLLRVAFGVTDDSAWAEIRDAAVAVRFGRFDFVVPLAGVSRWRIEGPWAWITAIGVRRSLRHGDVSFAGSPRGGVRLDFREPVPWFFFRVPAAYYGVEDLEGLAAALEARGIPGEDARTGARTG
ncbi:MAG TPA: hypothetical protein VFY23_04605 [Candidatus Limnocylindrales bacterium]|nr:hypothetical protein [Candidatus Limnocylindrales bacterium]